LPRTAQHCKSEAKSEVKSEVKREAKSEVKREAKSEKGDQKIRNRVARWYVFKPKIPILVYF
jgi:hypothetical protein